MATITNRICEVQIKINFKNKQQIIQSHSYNIDDSIFTLAKKNSMTFSTENKQIFKKGEPGIIYDFTAYDENSYNEFSNNIGEKFYPVGYPWGCNLKEFGLSRTYTNDLIATLNQHDLFTITTCEDSSSNFRITTPNECGISCIYVNDRREYISFEGGGKITISNSNKIPEDTPIKYGNIFAGIIDEFYTVVLDNNQRFCIRSKYNQSKNIFISNINGKIYITGENRKFYSDGIFFKK